MPPKKWAATIQMGGIMFRRKFHNGDRVTGNDRKASFRGRRGVVLEYGPHKAEYCVFFVDGKIEFVNSEWLDRID